MGLFLLAVVVLLITSFWFTNSLKRKAEAELAAWRHGVIAVVERHIRALATKYQQSISRDAYGRLLTEKWFEERDYFVLNVLAENVDVNQYDLNHMDTIYVIIESHVQQHIMSTAGSDAYQDIEAMTGGEYEQYCASRLEAHGWRVRVTPEGADQGVDIIAEKDGVKVVVQCKRYSQPVGNKAVQEAMAGKQFEGAAKAAVVSNASFTTAARQLAAKANVQLLHHSELDSLGQLA